MSDERGVGGERGATGGGGETACMLTITGSVQGVFYRRWAQETARALGVLGWVRNRRDGSVEAFVQGAHDPVARFIAAAHDGPDGAEVAGVSAVPAATQEVARFEVLPDA